MQVVVGINFIISFLTHPELSAFLSSARVTWTEWTEWTEWTGHSDNDLELEIRLS